MFSQTMLLRHFFLLSCEEDFSCFDVSGNFYVCGADVATAAAFDTGVYIIVFRDIEGVAFDSVGDSGRVNVLWACFEASSASYAGGLSLRKFCLSDLLSC